MVLPDCSTKLTYLHAHRETQHPYCQGSLIEGSLINCLEELILSGELKTGARLPAECEFAARLGISRPVLHEALVDLAAKGLVQIAPRRGVFINDFRTYGFIAILESLLCFVITAVWIQPCCRACWQYARYLKPKPPASLPSTASRSI